MSYAADAIASLQKFATPNDFLSDLTFAFRTNLATCIMVASFPMIASMIKSRAKSVDREYRIKQLKFSSIPAFLAVGLAFFDTWMKTGVLFSKSFMAYLNVLIIAAVIYAAWVVAITV
eukprot:jgi/Mesvir1/18140/Mv09438-RA.1